MRISDWSSDVCSSDLGAAGGAGARPARFAAELGGLRLRRPHEPVVRLLRLEIGSASCRERVCPYVKISVVAVSLKKKKEKWHTTAAPTHDRNTRMITV